MAEFKFGVLSIKTSLEEQSVFIECSLDINEDTVTNGNIFLLQYSNKRSVPIDIIVDNHFIQLKLKEWAVPNEKYTVIIESGIESIVGDKLEASLMRNLEFESEITSTMLINSPANFEHTTGVTNISFTEKLKDNTGKNKHRTLDYVPSFCYFLEIAEENAFYNVIYRTYVDKTAEAEDAMLDEYDFSIKLKEIEKPGQYYVRIRAQKDENATVYGRWSPVVTFIKSNAETAEETKKVKDTKSQKDNSTVVDTGLPEVSSLIEQPQTNINKYENLNFEYDKYTEITPKEFTVKIPDFIDLSKAEFKIIRSDT